VEPLKKRWTIGAGVIAVAMMLAITGCSSNQDAASSKPSTQSAALLKDQSATLHKENGNSITDSDLLNAAQKDSTDNLGSMDIQIPQQQLSSDDINALLNDDNSLIPTNLNIK
jgi:hypothetical protein